MHTNIPMTQINGMAQFKINRSQLQSHQTRQHRVAVGLWLVLQLRVGLVMFLTREIRS